MEQINKWIKPELKRAAFLEKDMLAEQASLVYALAMKGYAEGDTSTYDLLQGVAHMLFMLKCGDYEISVTTNYDNLKVY
jgi:hypothetical protein